MYLLRLLDLHLSEPRRPVCCLSPSQIHLLTRMHHLLQQLKMPLWLVRVLCGFREGFWCNAKPVKDEGAVVGSLEWSPGPPVALD